MLINKVYRKVNELVNKDQVGGFLAPSTFNEYAELAQYDYVSERFNPQTKRGFESTNKLSEEFSELKRSATLTISSGKAQKPADFLFLTSSWGYGIFNNAGSIRVMDIVRDDEWPQRLSSQIEPPSKMFPVMRNIDGYFEVRPDTLPQVQIEYIKIPAQPWWNYTQGADFIPVFAETSGITTDPVGGNNSIDFELPDSALPYLVYKIAAYFGISIREADVYQMISAEQVNEH